MPLPTLGLGGISGGLLTLGLGISPGSGGGPSVVSIGGYYPTPIGGVPGGGGGMLTLGMGGGSSGLVTGGLGMTFGGGGGIGEGYETGGDGGILYTFTPVGPTSLYIEGEPDDVDILAGPDGSRHWKPLGGSAWNIEGHTSFQFCESGGCDNVPFYPAGTPIRVEIGGWVAFRGRTAAVMPAFTGLGWVHTYTCYSAEWWANRLPVTHPQKGTGRIVYNLRENDPEYVEDESGLTVGAIMVRMFEAHEEALATAGILDWDEGEFATMDVVSSEPVAFGGMGLFHQLRDFAGRWAGDHAIAVDVEGTIRCMKRADFPAFPLDLAQEVAATPPALSRDTSDCYGAVRVRGREKIKAATIILSKGDLEPSWEPEDEAEWKLDDLSGGDGSVDAGTIVASTFSTVTVESDSSSKTWAANSWVGRKGRITLWRPVTGGITVLDDRKITANTALTAGGTSVLTLDYPLDTDAGWTEYRLIGNGGGSGVYRDYDVTLDHIKDRLVTYSARPMPVSTSSGTIGISINRPAGWAKRGATEFPIAMDVVPSEGKVRFRLPTPYPFNTIERLREGNPGLVEADDVAAAVFWSEGPMEVRVPEAGYEGTGHEEDGLTLEYVDDQNEWDYPGDVEQFAKYARMMLDTLKDVVREGTAGYEGIRPDLLLSSPFASLAVVATGTPGWTTGMEDIRLEIRTLTLSWEEGGGAPLRMSLDLSNRKRFATAPQAYLDATMSAGIQAGVFGQGYGLDGYGYGPGHDDGPILDPRPIADFRNDQGALPAQFGGMGGGSMYGMDISPMMRMMAARAGEDHPEKKPPTIAPERRGGNAMPEVARRDPDAPIIPLVLPPDDDEDGGEFGM